MHAHVRAFARFSSSSGAEDVALVCQPYLRLSLSGIPGRMHRSAMFHHSMMSARFVIYRSPIRSSAYTSEILHAIPGALRRALTVYQHELQASVRATPVLPLVERPSLFVIVGRLLQAANHRHELLADVLLDLVAHARERSELRLIVLVRERGRVCEALVHLLRALAEARARLCRAVAHSHDNVDGLVDVVDSFGPM